MKTLAEASTVQGVTQNDTGLRLHFSSLPNWYGCILGFDCPVCENLIDWKWVGEMPGFTTPQTTAHLHLVVTGAALLGHGHRWIQVECNNCHTNLTADNFD